MADDLVRVFSPHPDDDVIACGGTIRARVVVAPEHVTSCRRGRRAWVRHAELRIVVSMRVPPVRRVPQGEGRRQRRTTRGMEDDDT